MSTIYKSPQHSQSHFSAYCVFSSRSLAAASNSGDFSQPPVLITSRHGSHRKHSFISVASNCCIIKNLLRSNGNVFTEPLPRNSRCLQSHRLATVLYAAMHYTTLPSFVKSFTFFLNYDCFLLYLCSLVTYPFFCFWENCPFYMGFIF
jgi:hypothetical protein